ncbi:hypothetical protein RKD22_003128 [Streptomyces pristinaespiralis]
MPPGRADARLELPAGCGRACRRSAARGLRTGRPSPARGCAPGPSGPPAPGADGHAPAQTACRARQGTSGPPGGEGRRPAQAARGRGRGCPRLKRPATDADAPLERSAWHGRARPPPSGSPARAGMPPVQRLARVRPGQAARRARAAGSGSSGSRVRAGMPLAQAACHGHGRPARTVRLARTCMAPAQRLAGADGHVAAQRLARVRPGRASGPPGTGGGLRVKRLAGAGGDALGSSGLPRTRDAPLERSAWHGRAWPPRSGSPARTVMSPLSGLPSADGASGPPGTGGGLRVKRLAGAGGDARLERPAKCGRCPARTARPARTGMPSFERSAWHGRAWPPRSGSLARTAAPLVRAARRVRAGMLPLSGFPRTGGDAPTRTACLAPTGSAPGRAARPARTAVARAGAGGCRRRRPPRRASVGAVGRRRGRQTIGPPGSSTFAPSFSSFSMKFS